MRAILSRPAQILALGALAAALAGCSSHKAAQTTAAPVERVGAYAPASGVVHAVVESTPVAGTVRLGPAGGLGRTPAAAVPVRRHRPAAGQRPQVRRVPTEATSPPPPPPLPPAYPELSAAGRAVEQTQMGQLPPAKIVASFDGLGTGFVGLHPPAPVAGNRPRRRGGALDLSLAAGPTQVVEIINSRLAVFNKRGKLLYGDVPTNTIFAGFGGRCASTNNGDAVVRYDQLAQRWLFVMPIFSRPPGDPTGPYGMCYAVSTSSNALGTYNRYEFQRPLFTDYPRPSVWPDGYYVPTSSGDGVIQKAVCIADRAKMLKGEPATEQCVVIDGVSFLLNADVDGPTPPPAGTPNIMMANGGTQLKGDYSSDVIYWFKVHVDWNNYKQTTVTPGAPIKVAPYHFLCNGQLSNCVPQPGAYTSATTPPAERTAGYLDSQGDKLMQRLVYRNIDGHQVILAADSVDTAAQAGGVRWYAFRLGANSDPVLYQQGTYAPDAHSRFMPSIDMDKFGDIGIGYTYGGDGAYAGQRFAARLQGDPLGKLTVREAVLAEGHASQRGNRWEDYTTTAMDPADDCTFWYVGDYLKAGATTSTTRIGAFRLPSCKK